MSVRAMHVENPISRRRLRCPRFQAPQRKGRRNRKPRPPCQRHNHESKPASPNRVRKENHADNRSRRHHHHHKVRHSLRLPHRKRVPPSPQRNHQSKPATPNRAQEGNRADNRPHHPRHHHKVRHRLRSLRPCRSPNPNHHRGRNPSATVATRNPNDVRPVLNPDRRHRNHMRCQR